MKIMVVIGHIIGQCRNLRLRARIALQLKIMLSIVVA
jgi:hypothetical protein